MEKYNKAIEAIKNSSKESSIYVGVDSQVFSRRPKGKDKYRVAKYSVVILLHYDSSSGAGIIFQETVEMREYGNLRQRLMNEVMMAAEAAIAVADYVGERNFEVHIDINPDEKHKSSIAVKEAIGYITGQLGFAPKVKPDSFAATHCSDHIVKGKMEISS